jgi:hypothetical protein
MKEVGSMAATVSIEVESGTTSGRLHPHNGYYAGDFSGWHEASADWHEPIPAFDL